MIIKSIFEKIQNWVLDHQNDIVLAVGVVLISLLSFAMGYLFAKQQDKTPIRFEMINQEGILSEANDFRDVSGRERAWFPPLSQKMGEERAL